MAFFTLCEGSLYPFYFAVTHSFALYSWVSILALVGMYQGWRGHPWRFALAGIAIGLAHLTRADGVLLLGVGCLVWLCSQRRSIPRQVSLFGSQVTPPSFIQFLGKLFWVWSASIF